MVNALLDTNILIDYLNAIPQARDELRRYDAASISIITWIEVLVGAPAHVEQETRAFLAGFRVVPLDDEVAERALAIRQTRGIKLPDAIIWASAEVGSLLLVTRNTKDFGASEPGIRVPYSL